MSNTTSKTSKAPLSETTSQSPFITPEMIDKNPLLEVAGAFADDPYWGELMAEIKRERTRQRRREARKVAK